jgi:hypothetical protein
LGDGHYFENRGTTPVRFLEVFKSNHYADVSLNQCLALMPSELVQAHLKLESPDPGGIPQGEVAGRTGLRGAGKSAIRVAALQRLALAQIFCAP